MAILDECLTKKAAASELGTTTRTLDRWWAERVGPPRIKIGRAVYYKKDSLRDWINTNEQTPVRELQSGRKADTCRARRVAA